MNFERQNKQKMEIYGTAYTRTKAGLRNFHAIPLFEQIPLLMQENTQSNSSAAGGRRDVNTNVR